MKTTLLTLGVVTGLAAGLPAGETLRLGLQYDAATRETLQSESWGLRISK